MVHYAVLVIGFVLAIGILGVDMTKFTILAGAFGVGLGFGLQNILNNFFSGLILLFERPVKVGDVVDVSGSTGVVQHIGIRATTVRTNSGSEIIIPNGNLISAPVTNWTFRANQRIVEIPISVAPDANPQRVMQLLESVAKAHPEVVATPPPKALLLKMSAASLDFELHASTRQPDQWLQVRSELTVALNDMLAREKIAVR